MYCQITGHILLTLIKFFFKDVPIFNFSSHI
jgi:hypothetical protein